MLRAVACYLLSCCWAEISRLLWRRGGSWQEREGRLFSDLVGTLSLSPFGRKSGLKRAHWNEGGCPHLTHLPSNFREGLGSNAKPFYLSLSLFPFSRATVCIGLCLLPPFFLLSQLQRCILALSRVKSDFGTVPSALMKVTAGRVSGI